MGQDHGEQGHDGAVGDRQQIPPLQPPPRQALLKQLGVRQGAYFTRARSLFGFGVSTMIPPLLEHRPLQSLTESRWNTPFRIGESHVEIIIAEGTVISYPLGGACRGR